MAKSDTKVIIDMDRYRELLKKEQVADLNAITIKVEAPLEIFKVYITARSNPDAVLDTFSYKLSQIVKEAVTELNVVRGQFLEHTSEAYNKLVVNTTSYRVYEDVKEYRAVIAKEKEHSLRHMASIFMEKLKKLLNL